MHKMEIFNFPESVACVLNELINEVSTQEIWFIGSRANGNERIDSDWDFIVFVNEEINVRNARRDNVDIVQVDKNNIYLLEGQNLDMAGSFEKWKWRETDTRSSLYTVRKTPDVESEQGFNLSEVKYIDLNGIKVWHRNA